MVVLVGWLARELGGGRVAMVLAGLATLVAPAYLALDHFYSMNALDILFWTGAVCLVARILRDPPGATWRTWALLGLVLGLGLLNKASVLWLMGGVSAGLLATRHRRLLATPGPWLAVALAGILVAPHLLWQVTHGWPTREFVKHATEDKMAAVSLSSFLRAQVDDMHPLTALLLDRRARGAAHVETPLRVPAARHRLRRDLRAADPEREESRGVPRADVPGALRRRRGALRGA